jgi:hypothetical protein
MSKLGRLLDLLLPELICLDPMGAIAYYNSESENEAEHPEPAAARQRAHFPDAIRGPVVVQVAQQ